MARLEIELGAVNADLKRVLKESKVELSNFSKGLNFKSTGVNSVNTSLAKTKQLLKEVIALSNQARSGLGGVGAGSSGNSTSQINQERVATAQARTEAANYRTEQARLRAELAAVRLEQGRNRTSITAASGSYREAQQTLTALGASIRNAAGGFRSTDPVIRGQIRQYRELNTSLRAFDAQLGNHQRNVGNYSSVLRGLGSLAASYFGFTALLAAGRQVLKTNSEISDSLSDVRRTAGLTEKQAQSLADTLKGIDTRTSLKDLLGISVIGGQLGIAQGQLAGFTKAVDQLAVTLSGELQGGAEGIAKSLGVLDNVFKVSESNAGDVNDAYNKIGSAILSLGQSGLATGDFLADFGERVGGLAKQAGLSLPVILSYGAVLQENGVSAEVAGTAFKRLLSALSTNSSKFFAVAQMADANLTLKDFNTIVNTDTKKALDLFFAGLQKGGTSTIAFNSILKTLKLSQAGVSQSIAALANNLPALDEHIKQTTKDFNDGSISADQFAVKNDNLAASVDKLGNAFTNAVSKGSIAAFFKSITDGLTAGIIKFDKFVNSASWKEFKARLLDADGGDSFEVNASIDKLTKRTNDNQKFLYPQGGSPEQLSKKFAAVGQTGFNNYLSALKKTADESKATLEQFQKDVKSGKLKDLGGKGGIVDFTETYNKAKTYYNDLLALQKQLGFDAVKATPGRSNAATPDGFEVGGKKGAAGFSLSETLEKLRGDLVEANVQFGATFGDINKAKIDAYQKAINEVAKALGSTNSQTISLQKSQRDLFQLPQAQSLQSRGVELDDKLNKKIAKEFKAKIKVDMTTVKPDSLYNKEAAKEAKEFSRELGRSMSMFSSDLFSTLTEVNTKAYTSFGNALAGIGADLANSLIGSFNNIFLGQFQKQLTDVLGKAFDSMSDSQQKLAGAAILLGSVVSGLFSKTSSGGQALGGALKGAGAGAIIGSAVPVVGTVIGAAAGAIVGAIGGLFGASKAKKEEAMRKAQLEEQKKQTALLERQNALAYSASIIGRQTVNGVVTSIEVDAMGELKAKFSGQDMYIILQRAAKSRLRGV